MLADSTMHEGRRQACSGLALYREGDGSAIELDPRDFNRVDDARGHIDEDRGSHADLQCPSSDDPGFFKSRVTHRGPRAGPRRRSVLEGGRPQGAAIGCPYFNLA